LHIAIEMKHAQVVRTLKASGAQSLLYLENGNGCTPLHVAALSNATEMCTILLEGNQKSNEKALNARNRKDKNRTPLHIAVEKQAVDVIKVLVKTGSNLEALDEDALTPIDVACTQERPDSLQAIIDACNDSESKKKTA